MTPENRKRALALLREELPALTHEDAVAHYEKLIKLLESPCAVGPTIAVFQPIAVGDIICTQFGAELFQLKYPNCSVTFLTETPEALPVLRNNPFIDNVILARTEPWMDLSARLKKTYTHSYMLYWWNPPSAICSFLEDMELPTDYLRIKLYKHQELNDRAKKLWGSGVPKIALQGDIDKKWNADCKQRLIYELKRRGTVRLLDPSQEGCETYLGAIELLRQADILVCACGSLCHAANAVGTPTAEISTVYSPEWVSPAYFQNKYTLPSQHSVVIRPPQWCGNYKCVITKKDQYSGPVRIPTCFPDRFAPQFGECSFGFKPRSCVYHIPVESVLKAVDGMLGRIGVKI